MPDTAPEIATSADGVALCKAASIAAIDRATLDTAAMDRFWEHFQAIFAKNLPPGKIDARWRDHGSHLLYLAGLIGSLAQFNALRDPRSPQTVSDAQLKWAIGVVQQQCRLVIGDDEQNKYPFLSYCDFPG